MASDSYNSVKDSELETWLVDAKHVKQIITDINQIAPKLQYSLQKQHKYSNQLFHELQSIYISAANVNNPYSNPEDPFAEFLIEMGQELQKFELIEKDNLQIINKDLTKPIQKFKRSQYNKITSLKKKYRNLRNKYQKTKDKNILTEVNKIKNRLIPEIYSIKSNQNTDLLNHLELYWKSLSNLANTKHNIIEHSNLSEKESKEDNINENENKFEPDFDMKEVDEQVGFTDIQKNIVKFMIKRIHIKTLNKYNRVIYIDSTQVNNKMIKFLSLKNHLKEYMVKDIEKVEKIYNECMSELKIKFKDKKEYHYEFESPIKREEFVGELLEYNENGNKDNQMLSILVTTWNVGESAFNIENVRKWFPSSKEQRNDLYVIGLQEVKNKNKWVSGILSYIDSDCNEYLILEKTWLMAIGILVIIHIDHIAKISHLQCSTVATGKGNIIGNKGGVAISFQFMESTFLFVNCHLAARAERLKQRAENFSRIVKELHLGIIKNIDILHQFTHVFWFGDLNYRIEKEFNEVLQLIKHKKWNDIFECDQLYDQMKFDTVFSGFKEGIISFCPTYRWERTKNTVSNKRNQPPSYTDRILYRTLPNTFDLWQETYDSSPNCFGSDHRPIISRFKFQPHIPYFSASFRRKYSEIAISFVELKAKIQTEKDINIKNTMDIIFHCLYSSPMIYKLKNGKYDTVTNEWIWPIMELDGFKIIPFISDPSFLCTTHLLVSVLQKNNILCHGVISLFNAFPNTLVNTQQIKEEYKMKNKQMETVNNNNENDENINQKAFDVKLSSEGSNVGNLKGFINIDGELIRKHIRYSTIDAHKKITSPKSTKTRKTGSRIFNTNFWNKNKK